MVAVMVLNRGEQDRECGDPLLPIDHMSSERRDIFLYVLILGE
jgi:hypothetical protein